MTTTPTRTLDTQELERHVKHMYEEVARHPEAEFHFETGRALAERLGYAAADLDRIPAPAIDSFAGVGPLPRPRGPGARRGRARTSAVDLGWTASSPRSQSRRTAG